MYCSQLVHTTRPYSKNAAPKTQAQASPAGPTFLGTDNRANLLVANETGSVSRARHALRRYAVLQERVRGGLVTLGHVPDADNPSDFLTKFVSAKKLEASVAYLTNSANRVLPGAERR